MIFLLDWMALISTPLWKLFGFCLLLEITLQCIPIYSIQKQPNEGAHQHRSLCLIYNIHCTTGPGNSYIYWLNSLTWVIFLSHILTTSKHSETNTSVHWQVLSTQKQPRKGQQLIETCFVKIIRFGESGLRSV